MCLMNARSLTVTASPSPRVGRALLAALAALALVCATALAGSAQGAESSCANVEEPVRKEEERLRSENRSTQLAQCRVYELVSPVDTANSGVLSFPGAAPDGEAAEFWSAGAFAGDQSDYGFGYYIARRGSKGWQTESINAPAALGGHVNGTSSSFDLSRQVGKVHFSVGEKNGTCGLLLNEDLLAAPALSFVEVADYPSRGESWLGYCVSVQDETPDQSRLFFGATHFHYIPVVEISGAGTPAEALRTVSIVEGKAILAAVGNGAGDGNAFDGTLYHAVSDDGAVVFFTPGEGGGFSGESYVRVNGKTTLALGGLFQGASGDGSKVFLRGEGETLVMDKIDVEPGHETLTKVSISHGARALYVRSGDDGSHVYFVSSAVLASNENENKERAVAGKGTAVESEWNLYVYDTLTKQTAFIARALPGGCLNECEKTTFGEEPTGDIATGSNVEEQVNGCPSKELGETEEPGCEGGRFFVFTTMAHITPGDTAVGRQVFEYDAKTGRLARVSTGEDGYANNGNDNVGLLSAEREGASISPIEFGAFNHLTQTELAADSTRAVSDDGSTVVFESAGALSPRAVNDLQGTPGPVDVYEWHDGRVSLISTGHSLTSDSTQETHATITPSGRDIFFSSTENILPQKSDGLLGLFDARIDGGFPAAPIPAGGCNGDACQGPPSVPNLLAAPASETFSGLGNPAPPAPTPAVKAKPKSKPAKCRKGYVKKKNKCVKKSKPKKKATKSSRDRRIK
jgi:hypothetical protein